MSTVAVAAWKVRHQGSPRSVDDLTFEQVLEGLQDGLWEATDEVMGPDDGDWVAIENHPRLAEIAADLEPPPPRTYDDETRLDMNALIDVCLVLLIFFILTTSYAILQKRLEQPPVSEENVSVPIITPKDLTDQLIYVKVTMENGQPVIRLEDKIVDLTGLKEGMRRAASKTKTKLALDVEDEVPHGTVVAIQDAASGAGLEGIRLVIPAGKP